MPQLQTKVQTHLLNPMVKENAFLTMKQERKALPSYKDAIKKLPKPVWMGHENAIACYWKAWEIAFRNLKQPVAGTRFVSNFIDTAFNGDLFMWDSGFIVMFGRYGSRAFNFQGTLDNFYSHQHPDGFICRQIRESDGEERFDRFNPSSTGPNILPWAEWEYYLNFGDKKRLARVFPPLLAFYEWFKAFRTWPDGTYWSTGWGCGMDNQPRLKAFTAWEPMAKDKNFPAWSHGHMSWIDTTLQQIFTARILIMMGRELGQGDSVKRLLEENGRLSRFVNASMWDDRKAFYFDRYPDGTLSKVMSVSAYWALLAGTVKGAGLKRFLAHLDNPAEFRRPHPVPSLSASHPGYKPHGGYWQGAVWPCTNYMLLRGLSVSGQDALAHRIARAHLDNVVQVFEDTGTLWENYAPEFKAHGDTNTKPDFVGWTGIPPIAVLFEYVFGLRPDVPENRLIWDVRLTDEHAVTSYPFGKNGMLSLKCAARKSESEEPDISAKTNIPLTLELKWKGGKKHIRLKP